MSLHENSSTLNAIKMGENSEKVTTNGNEVRIVTIAGKEVELKYETRVKKYDIFGLHSRERRFGNRKPRTNDMFNNIGNNNAVKKNILNDKQDESLHTSNNNLSICSTSSSNSKETSVGSTKLSRLLKRIESDERSPKKYELSIEKIADKIKKEPVKMENRFDMLLPSSNGEELKLFLVHNSDSILKSSAKKRKKKKTKINNELINNSNNTFDNNSEDFDAHQELIAQKVILVQKPIESIYGNESNDELFESNNNNNNHNNNRKNGDEKQKDYKILKHGFNSTLAQVNDEFAEEEHVEQEVKVSEIIKEKVDFIEKEDKRDEGLLAFRKETKKQSFKTKYPNGLIKKPIVLKDNSVKSYDRNKSKNGESDQNEELRQKVTNESSLNENLFKLIINWLFITLLVVVFLVIYSLVILNQFCDCSQTS